MIIGIDQSKRSTGLVSLDMEGNFVDCCLITPPKSVDGEFLIDYIWNKIDLFLQNMELQQNILAVALESAAFSAKGSSNDIIWGIQWHIRTSLLRFYPNILRGILTSATWRSTVLPLESQRAFKTQYGGTIGLKHCTVAHLPEELKEWFESYVEAKRGEILISKGFEPDSRSKSYKDAIFDLADAWGIAYHRYLLHIGRAKPTKKKKSKVTESKLKRRFPQAK